MGKNNSVSSLYDFLIGSGFLDSATNRMVSFVNNDAPKLLESYNVEKPKKSLQSSDSIVNEHRCDGTVGNKAIDDVKSIISEFIKRNKSFSILTEKEKEIFDKLDTDPDFANKAIAEYDNIVKAINENRDSYNEVIDFLVSIGFIDADMLKALMRSILQPKTKEASREEVKEKNQPVKPDKKVQPEPKQAAAQQQPKPVAEQPQVAHDLQQQPFGYNPAVFMQGGQQPNAIPVGQIVSTAQQIANNPQGVTMTFEEKVDYVKKHIKFIEGTHPGVNEDWFNAFIDLFKYNKFFKNKLKEYNSECRPNNPMLFEIKLENNENGLYDIAFRVNCKDKKQFILVRYGTKKVPYTDGTVRYPIDMTLMGA